eukprot:1183249-Prorocentrum_minimum.AAC.3
MALTRHFTAKEFDSSPRFLRPDASVHLYQGRGHRTVEGLHEEEVVVGAGEVRAGHLYQGRGRRTAEGLHGEEVVVGAGEVRAGHLSTSTKGGAV